MIFKLQVSSQPQSYERRMLDVRCIYDAKQRHSNLFYIIVSYKIEQLERGMRWSLDVPLVNGVYDLFICNSSPIIPRKPKATGRDGISRLKRLLIY